MVGDKEIRVLRTGITNRAVRDLAVGAAKAGFRFKLTKRGVMFFGENGQSMTIHFTVSDHRGVKNASAAMRKIGYHHPKKGHK